MITGTRKDVTEKEREGYVSKDCYNDIGTDTKDLI